MGKFKPTELQKEIVKKANIQGKIKNIINFSDESKNYSIIINRITRFPCLYAIRLVHYEEYLNDSSVAFERSKYRYFFPSKDVPDVKINAVKRFPDLIGFYQTNEQVNREVENIKGNKELINQCIYEVETQEDEVENILLIGRTGSGKSTLANVLTNTDKFTVSAGFNSKTRKFKSEVFEVSDQEETKKKIKYRVIDTIGVGDTELSRKKIVLNLAEAIYIMKKGIKRVLMVVGTRLTKEEIDSFRLARRIFGEEIFEYTTVVRSNYKNFRDMEGKSDDNDREILRKKIGFTDIPIDIIYVNNPPLDNDERRRVFDKEDRKSSREVLLRYLKSDKCQKTYKLENWDTTCVRINDYMNAKMWKEDNEDTKGGLLSKNELKEITNEVVEEMKHIKLNEAEFQISVGIPMFGNIQTAAKFKNCCSII
ncbi:P-loop containing nucleoside triphosphate hydrolase protein [Glomus cerebriforme]|uniref:P-loop containing nucleoside triphosphate hydrolase protein n=1 Tax=Glomus cerebriforme TaxID=658196 RepID=A0A397T4K9_9GLOM|nr:P-loop containing nucleoside triphosphate hydrolase protein [Glomus cerebriforme]